MIWILIAAVLLILGSAWLLARPARLSGAAAAGREERSELAVVRDRLLAQLNELDIERGDRAIDSGVAQDEERRAQAELAAVLKRLDELDQAVPTATGVAGGNRWLRSAALLALLVAIGGGLYSWQNAPMLMGIWRVSTGGASAPAQVPPMVLEMVARLEKRLAEQPDDAGGWARLARSYMVLERRDDALKAYGKAYALAPDNLEILADYAWVRFNLDPGNTEGEVHTLYSRLIKLDPVNPDALWFMGLAAYQRGEFRQTVKYWEKLAGLLSPQDPALPELNKAIAEVRGHIKK